MKKSTKIYLGLCAVAFAITIGFIAWPSHHKLASDPHKVGKIVNLDLPEIAEYERGDNLDRGASRWDFYEYRAMFAEEISEECIAEMERRCIEDCMHWSKDADEGCYIYKDMGGVDELYEVGCTIYKDRVSVGYLIDEDEGIFVIMILFVLYQAIFWWGVTLFIIWVVRKCRAKQAKKHELNKPNEA